jgi:hypothetical protein
MPSPSCFPVSSFGAPRRPSVAGRGLLALAKRRLGLQPVGQKMAGGERCLAMRRGAAGLRWQFTHSSQQLQLPRGVRLHAGCERGRPSRRSRIAILSGAPSDRPAREMSRPRTTASRPYQINCHHTPGEVYVSEDAGASWRKIAPEFGEIRGCTLGAKLTPTAGPMSSDPTYNRGWFAFGGAPPRPLGGVPAAIP